MNELPRIITDVQMLLALTPEELAEKMLFLLKKRNDEKFYPGNLQENFGGTSLPAGRNTRGSMRTK